MRNRAIRMAALALLTVPALAGEADVIEVEATRKGDVWRFSVTVRHADAGWDHYADAWRVVAPDGTLLGRRTLHHPHESEQPFTRSLSGVRIPAGVRTVTIEARDSVHGWGGATLRIDLDRSGH